MFTEALFTITKLWKQPKCSTTGEWMKKLWKYIPWIIIQLTKKRKSCLLLQHE